MPFCSRTSKQEGDYVCSVCIIDQNWIFCFGQKLNSEDIFKRVAHNVSV